MFNNVLIKEIKSDKETRQAEKSLVWSSDNFIEGGNISTVWKSLGREAFSNLWRPAVSPFDSSITAARPSQSVGVLTLNNNDTINQSPMREEVRQRRLAGLVQ